MCCFSSELPGILILGERGVLSTVALTRNKHEKTDTTSWIHLGYLMVFQYVSYDFHMILVFQTVKGPLWSNINTNKNDNNKYIYKNHNYRLVPGSIAGFAKPLNIKYTVNLSNIIGSSMIHGCILLHPKGPTRIVGSQRASLVNCSLASNYPQWRVYSGALIHHNSRYMEFTSTTKTKVITDSHK